MRKPVLNPVRDAGYRDRKAVSGCYVIIEDQIMLLTGPDPQLSSPIVIEDEVILLDGSGDS